MKKVHGAFLLVSGLILSLGVLAAATSVQQEIDIKPSDVQKVDGMRAVQDGLIPGETPDNQWLCEPVFIFDSTGLTRNGRVHLNLSVYNNGMITLAEFTGQNPGKNTAKMVKTSEVERFFGAVTGTGAWTLKDQQLARRGSPMRSVTLFEGTTDAKAHSFNYFNATGDYKAVEAAVNAFIKTHFGELSG